MLLSSYIMKICDVFGIKETFSLFAKAGIQGVDFSSNIKEYCSIEHDKSFYIELGKYAKEEGLAICQAHAPFPSSDVDREKNEKRFAAIVQGMRNSSYLGAPAIVVHPCKHLDFGDEANRELLFEYNIDFYRRLIPYAEELGIKIAIENLGSDSVTSTPENLIRLYDELDNQVFTVCFDVGHSLLQGVDPAEAIGKIGKRLVNGYTHIHDNFGDTDAHMLPFYGKVDWENVMKALAVIGYNGDLNFEAGGFARNLPRALCFTGLAYMSNVGHYLIERFEYYSNCK